MRVQSNTFVQKKKTLFAVGQAGAPGDHQCETALSICHPVQYIPVTRLYMALRLFSKSKDSSKMFIVDTKS